MTKERLAALMSIRHPWAADELEAEIRRCWKRIKSLERERDQVRPG